MLRITKIAETPSSVTLKVEGRIVEEWGSFVIAKIREYSNTATRLVLDFSGVTFIDEPAAAKLRGLSVQNIVIMNCSAFIDAMLRGWGNDPGNESN